ncbi:GxGYxYP domain-containing protein [Bacteroides sp.]|uniref:GxGYxYP domain-containing protein n=1 Tax=Bacteroides sp. TaxID=29523 RepID=UPI00261E6AFC|nr:GxGYxYP domain-containing protein [Bacteroides sp.]
MEKTITILITLIIFFNSSTSAKEYNGRYGWPVQRAPEKIIICERKGTLAEIMLLESLSGLAAKAVNEGKFNEMVWMDINNDSYKSLYESSLKALNISDVKKMDLWSLVDYLRKKKIINGYVLYKLEEKYDQHNISDYSSNVATVYASLLSGILIDESLRTKAQQHQLKELKDVRKETLEECFNKNSKKLNNNSALSIHPAVTNMRDYAIAHKLMLYSDRKALIEKVLEWVKPMSPILGWGCGDEYDFTSLISEWGHYNTASDWCFNLPFISSTFGKVELKKAKEISLKDIDLCDKSSFHSFVMSDGDNMQWTIGNFTRNKCYVGNEKMNKTGVSWTLCPINLSVISPFTWNELVDLQGDKNSYIEYGGGYQYPDLFAIKRPNRSELLREFAQRINFHLNQIGIKIFGFICRDVMSKNSQEAFQIYAEELTGITGMLAVQYFPYELGENILWYKNNKGIDIPVVTASYSLWDEVHKGRPYCGTPEYVASLINRDVISLESKKDNALSWTIVHAWSDFKRSSRITELPAVGMNPIIATEKLLLNQIKTISINELLWRIRMKYHPTQKTNNKLEIQ